MLFGDPTGELKLKWVLGEGEYLGDFWIFLGEIPCTVLLGDTISS